MKFEFESMLEVLKRRICDEEIRTGWRVQRVLLDRAEWSRLIEEKGYVSSIRSVELPVASRSPGPLLRTVVIVPDCST
jgi:hypothetical protein